MGGEAPLSQGFSPKAALVARGYDPIDVGAAVLGEHAQELQVAARAGTGAQVCKQLLGTRVLDAEPALHERVAAEQAAAGTAHAAAEPVGLLEHKDVGPAAGGLDGGRGSPAAAARHHNVGLVVPQGVAPIEHDAFDRLPCGGSV